MRRLRRIAHELRRKGLHVTGLTIPIVYYVGLKAPIPGAGRTWLTHRDAVIGLGIVTAAYFLIELIRLIDPDMNRFFIRRFRFLLRRSEIDNVTGSGYFLLGAFCSALWFPPVFAIASLLYLIFGDFAAAVVGKAVGRIRLIDGKSLEGSAACFVVCLAVGIGLFWKVPPGFGVTALLAVVGALTATLAELFPLKINDNLTIPLLSGAALMTAAQWMGVEIPLP